MKMSAITFILFLMLTFVLIVPVSAKNSTNVPDDVQQFAQASGIELFKTSASSDPEGFGFSSIDELNQIELGDGFPVYYVDYMKLKKDKSIKELKNMLKPTENWRFFVTTNGQPKSFITVGYENSNLTVVEYGGKSSGLGEAYEQVKRENPSDITLVEDSGNKYFVINKDKQLYVVSDVSEFNSNEPNYDLVPSEKLVEKIKKAPILSDSYVDDGTIGGSGTEHLSESPSLVQPLLISLATAIAGTVLFITVRKRISKP
ncbi:hypothetical protein [Litchfieldia salsa]|uniref:Uncharacterized protein n=1 Tax=Litchfieldia salsa TaxID=930152 RepID=A0A1H0W3U4_9BACI|nr:hypothetical protein [Litchfieldia salsa]SDP85161.1 hypothetical protein SAMN05216565_10916 [Litchfieldia salsa]